MTRLSLRRPRHAVVRAPLSGMYSFDVPPPTIATGPGSMRLHAVPNLRLRVGKGRLGTGSWIWRVINDDGTWFEGGHAPSHAQALAVGLAALEAATIKAQQ